MTAAQISHMFGRTPKELFRVHDWRNDVITLGTVPAEFVKEVSEGACDFTWPAQVNKLLKYGYFGTPHTLKMVKENTDLANNPALGLWACKDRFNY